MEKTTILGIILALVLILSINAAKNSNLPETCRHYGEICDLYRHHCCQNLACVSSQSMENYLCKEPLKLGDPCQRSTDCMDILHATCSAGTCTCRKNNIQVNDYACAPLLNEFCWKNETCATENSMCIDNECQCKAGFLPEAGQCRPGFLGSICSNDAACESVKYAKCSAEKVCACPENMIAKNGKFCASLIGGTCETNEECGVEHLLCIDNKCQCSAKYFAYSENECKLPYLGMPCKNSTDCSNFIYHSSCTNNKCACSDEYSPFARDLCKSGKNLYCFSDIDCSRILGDNSVCAATHCQCRPDYILRGSKCLPKFITGRCSTTADVSELRYAISSNNQCTCKAGYFSVNALTCGKVIGGSCSIDQDCAVRFSYCVARKCQCGIGYIQNSESECIATQLGSYCFNDINCRLIPNSQCFESLCICKDNFLESDTMGCAPLLNSTCTTTAQCISKNSVCIDNKCQCELRYFQQSHHKCVLKFLEYWCAIDEDCIDIPYAKCSDAGKCTCQANYKRIARMKCVPMLGGYCNQNKDCGTDDAVCSENQCVCSISYVQLSEDLCLPVFLGRFCENDKDCDKILNAECSEDKRCVCRSGYAIFDRHVCLPLIGGICTEHKDCNVYNSNCIDNTCQCLKSFISLSGSQCVATSLGDNCYSDNDCEIANSRCSRSNYCVCNNNFISTERKTCAPTLDGPCSETSNCIVANSRCIDEKCQCKPGFVNRLYNNCLSAHLEEFCETNDDCIEIKHSKCYNNKCTCRSNYIKVNSTTCLPLLNGACSADDECYVDDSICIDNECQCNSTSFFQVSFTCERISLGHPCKANNDCRTILNAVCIDDICSCRPKTFASSNRICTQYLNTTCLTSDDCGVESSHCVKNKCQCMPRWAAITDMMCVRHSALYYCDNAIECGEPWRSQCLQNHCVCQSKHVAVSTLSCRPILGGACWRQDQCIPDNSDCIDFRCQCKPGFAAVADNMCVAK